MLELHFYECKHYLLKSNNHIEKAIAKISQLQKVWVYNKPWINEKVLEARRKREKETEPLINCRSHRINRIGKIVERKKFSLFNIRSVKEKIL